MPIYEYCCRSCRRKMSCLVMAPASFIPECKYCRSRDLEQLFSRFSSPKSEDQRLESLADPARLSGLDENDPGSVARWMKNMNKELGEDGISGDEIEQMTEDAAHEAAGTGIGDADGTSSGDL